MRRDFDIRLAAGQVEKYPPLRTCLEYNCNEETGAMKCIMHGLTPFAF
jgi:hypothetical protein